MHYKDCIALLATLEDPEPEITALGEASFASTFVFTKKEKQEPLFNQWWKMVRSCYDTTFPLYRKCGAILGIDRMPFTWHNYSRFKTEFGIGFDPEPGFTYLCRYELDKPYSKDNCFWGMKMDGMVLQGRTVFIDTQWGKKTIRQLAELSHGRLRGAELEEKYWSNYHYTETDSQYNKVGGTVVGVNKYLPLLTESMIRYRLKKRIPVLSYVYPIHTMREEMTGQSSGYRHVFQTRTKKAYVPTGNPRGRPKGSKNKVKPTDNAFPADAFNVSVALPD